VRRLHRNPDRPRRPSQGRTRAEGEWYGFRVAAVVLILGAGLLFCTALVIWGNIETSSETVALILLITVLTLRPAILGELVGPAGLILPLVSLVFVFRGRRRNDEWPPRSQLVALGGCVLIPILLARGTSVSTMSGLAVTPVIAAVAWVAGREPPTVRRLTGLASILAAQQAIGLVVAHALSVGHWTLTISTGQERLGYRYQISHLGSITVGSGGVLSIYPERLTGPFGEPGVFAGVLAILAAIDMGTREVWRPSRQIPFISAIVLTQSIAGMGIYTAALVVFFVCRSIGGAEPLKRRYVVAATASLFGCLWAATRKDLVLAGKRSANAASVTDRLAGASPLELLQSLVMHPLGVVRQGDNSSINLLQAGLTYGPLFLACGLWLYLAPLRGSNWLRIAPAVASIVLTITFAQPPFLYSWIFLGFLVAGIASEVPVAMPTRTEAIDVQQGAETLADTA
jgi:hypothetical protein